MPRLRLCLLMTLVIAAPSWSQVPAAGLEAIARDVAAEHDVPAVGLAVAVPGKPAVVAVVGVRQRGGTPVDVSDAWHLGSCTKAVTALLAARLVEQGIVTWQTTPTDFLDSIPAAAREQNRSATLRSLLSHTSGLPGREADGVILPIARIHEARGATPTLQRRQVADAVLCLEPVAGPREQMNYINGGFILASAMLEAAAGRPLEELYADEVFEPLGITSAGWDRPPPSGATCPTVRPRRSTTPRPTTPPAGCTSRSPTGRRSAVPPWESRRTLSATCRVKCCSPRRSPSRRCRRLVGCGRTRRRSARRSRTAARTGRGSARPPLLSDRGIVLLIAFNQWDHEALDAARDELVRAAVEPVE